MPKENKRQEKYPEVIVGALIVNNNDKLLFCRSHKWKGKYTIFGGHVEYGENMEDAIIREIKEETGLDVKLMANIGASDSVFNPKFHEKKHFVFIDFLCQYDGGDDGITINDEYDNDFKWVTVDEAQKIDLADGARLILDEYIKSQKSRDNLEGWQRYQADFENYKKRQAQIQKEFVKYACQNVVWQLIPVLDNFHISTEHIPEDQKKGAWVVGIMHIQKQLEKVLTDNSIEEITAKVGDKFNPEIHEAMQDDSQKEISSKQKLEKRISRIVMKGYKMEGKVLRPVKVIVR